jgi:hypothetical protein
VRASQPTPLGVVLSLSKGELVKVRFIQSVSTDLGRMESGEVRDVDPMEASVIAWLQFGVVEAVREEMAVETAVAEPRMEKAVMKGRKK